LTRRAALGSAAASLGSMALAAGATRALAAMPEGKPGPDLVAYTGTGLQTDLADKLIEPFADYMNKKYGVPTRVQTVVGQSPTAWVSFKTQWPNPAGDTYQLYPEYIQEGTPKGYFLKLEDGFTPEEWATFDQSALETMDCQGYVAPMDISASVLVVQNSLKDPIDSWSALGDPKYKGRVTFDSALAVGSGYNMIAAGALAIGNDWNGWFKDGKFDEAAAMPAFKEVARWAGNALTLTQGSGSIRPLLRRGEALFSAWWWHNAVEEMQSGTPVHIVYPKEGLPASVGCGPVISAATKNPIGAYEWVRFFHSSYADEVAISIKEYNRIPRQGEKASDPWQEFSAKGKIAWVNDFRRLTLGQQYNEQVLELYNRVVIQGG
jgi:ABC-type Fe3+ transport system substrate-binding protein